MWGKLQALRDYHTASEEKGKPLIATLLLNGCLQGVLDRSWRLVILLQSSAWLIFLLAAEAQGVEQTLKVPILATCEVADIVEAVKTLQVFLTL